MGESFCYFFGRIVYDLRYAYLSGAGGTQQALAFFLAAVYAFVYLGGLSMTTPSTNRGIMASMPKL